MTHLPVLTLLLLVLCFGVVAADTATSQWGGTWTADCIKNNTPKTLSGTWTASVTATAGTAEGVFSADNRAACSGAINGTEVQDMVSWDIAGQGCKGRGRGSIRGNNVSGVFGGGDIGVEGCNGTFIGECVSGCSPNCTDGQISCQRMCVDINTDPLNCGNCSIRCPLGQVCQNGECLQSPPCPENLTRCNGTCVDANADLSNCGACGIKCSAGQACQGGKCANPYSGSGGSGPSGSSSCQAGLTLCGGICTNTTVDLVNCGACGTTCSAGQACQGGKCASPPSVPSTSSVNCSAGLSICSGICTDTKSDLSNCGACGTKCSAGQACVSGQCQCPSDMENCPSGCCPISHTANKGSDYTVMAVIGICIVILGVLLYLGRKKK